MQILEFLLLLINILDEFKKIKNCGGHLCRHELPSNICGRRLNDAGAGRSSEVERSLMVRWVVGSILHGVDPLSYFSFQPVLHDGCNKGRGMCYPVCGIMHIK